MQNFESKSKDLENAVTLYKMMFPTGRYAKEVNYLFLKYAYDIKNTSLMSEALAGVKMIFLHIQIVKKLLYLEWQN